jgi:hypothetical protein
VEQHLNVSQCTDKFKNALKSILLFQKYLSSLSFSNTKKYLENLKICSSEALQEDQKAVVVAVYNKTQPTIKNRFSTFDALNKNDEAALYNLFVEIENTIYSK